MKIRYRRDLWKLIEEKGLVGLDAVEIGVAEGYFSADMLSWPVNFPRVYMVDRWRSVPSQKGDASNPQEWHDKNLQAATERVRPYGERAIPLRGDSKEMAKLVPNLSLALVYIDGDHSFDGVVTDIEAWLPKLVRGGVMAFHDYLNPSYGVHSAVNTFAEGLGLAVVTLPEDKPEDAGAYLIC